MIGKVSEFGRRHLSRWFVAAVFWSASTFVASEDFFGLAKDILVGTDDARQAAAGQITTRGSSDMVPTLVLLMRIGGAHVATQEALLALTGEHLKTWREAMLYQEAHPEIVPHPSYYDLKLWYWNSIDDNFSSLFQTPIDPNKLRIRFEEITWGGALFDDIPSLDQPTMIPAVEADYLLDTDLVFGVEINGDLRAYPLRIMGWHEMLNDVVGGVPIALAYCTLCGTGILFETLIEAGEDPLVFGSSGLLYRSNKLMFDRETMSLWNQFTGEPVVGDLAFSEIRLVKRPMVITSWADWRRANPDTKVLSLDTGHFRDYGSGVVYRDYFASPDLLYPAITDETRLAQKETIFGIRVAGGAKAWPIQTFAERPVINDRVGFTNILLIGDANTRTVRAYDRGALRFIFRQSHLISDGQRWKVTESALIGQDGTKLPRVPGQVAYWFAWDGYLNAESELYVEPN